jgi:chromosome segregation ATPase
MTLPYDLQSLWVLLAGFLVGGTMVWAISSIFFRGRKIQALHDADTQLASAKAQTGELRAQLATLHQERDQLHQALRLMEVGKVSAETKLEETRRHLAEQRVLLEDAKVTLSDTFRSPVNANEYSKNIFSSKRKKHTMFKRTTIKVKP